MWLDEKILFFDGMHQTRASQISMDYSKYLEVLAEYKEKEFIHQRLRKLFEGSAKSGISADDWQVKVDKMFEIQFHWDTL